MGQDFKETAVHNVNKKKYDEGYARIFGKKGQKNDEGQSGDSDTSSSDGVNVSNDRHSRDDAKLED